MNDLNTIEYLSEGTLAQRDIFRLLNELQIMENLKEFDPVLAGTYPLGIEIEGSDLDIICSFSDAERFRKTLTETFKTLSFELTAKIVREEPTIICRFHFEGYKWEIFGQAVPTQEQFAVRHMLIEQKILQEQGDEFRSKIIDLKKEGLSTEAAFAKLLGLKGDPYLALLEYSKQKL